MDGWPDGWMDGKMHGMDGWMAWMAWMKQSARKDGGRIDHHSHGYLHPSGSSNLS